MTMSTQFSCVHYLRETRHELGGVVTAVIDLCQLMAARGHDITLVTSDAKDAPQEWKSPSDNWPRVIEIPHSHFSPQLLGAKALSIVDDAFAKADVVHLHTPWELNNLPLAKRARRRRVPYIVTVHGMLDDWSMKQKSLKKRLYLKLFGNDLFKRASTIHFTAQAEMEQAGRWIATDGRFAVQSCAIDLSAYRPLAGVEPALSAFPFIRRDLQKLLFLSRLHPKKGVDLLLQAARILKAASFPFQLLIAGPGDDSYVAELKRLSATLGVNDVTHFLGMVRGVKKRSLFELADAFVLPTHQENFGLVLAEAMACGTAVVTTRGTDIWHELEAGGACIVGLTPQEIADGILEVASDADRCRAIGQRGLEFVHEWLDSDHVSAGYDAMYIDAISRGLVR